MAFNVIYNKRIEATDASINPPYNPASNLNNNDWIGYRFDVIDGGSDFGVETGDSRIWLHESGSVLNFYVYRQSFNRTARFFNINSDPDVSLYIDRVQYLANYMYYSYTFDINGNLDITTDFSSQTYDISVTPLYTLQYTDGTIVGSSTPNYETDTPNWTDVPLQNLEVKIVDEYGTYYLLPITFVADNTLTLIKDIDKLSLSNNPMVAIWDSQLKYGDRTKYKYTMYDNSNNILLETSVYPDVNNNLFGIYNMNMLYNNYTTTNPNYFNEGGIVLTDNLFKYKYNITDQIDGSGITSATKYTIKGATEYGVFFNEDNYIGNLQENRHLLTSWSGDYLYNYNNYGVVNFTKGYFGGTGSPIIIDSVMITRYRYGDTPNYTDYTNSNRVLFVISTYNLDDDIIYQVPIGPKNIDIAFNSNMVTDNLNNLVTDNFLLYDDTEYYTIRVTWLGASGTAYSNSTELKIILNKKISCKFGLTQFMWLDQLGNYNTFSFENMNEKTYNIERNEINKDHYSMVGLDWTYNIGDRGQKNINIKKNEYHSVKSGWLDDNLSKNIMELYSSSDVYVIIDDNIYPIIITTNKVVEKNIKNNRLFNHSINYRMAYDLNINE